MSEQINARLEYQNRISKMSDRELMEYTAMTLYDHCCKEEANLAAINKKGLTIYGVISAVVAGAVSAVAQLVKRTS